MITIVPAYPFYVRLGAAIEWVLYGKKADVEEEVQNRLNEIQGHLIQPNDRAVIIGKGQWIDENSKEHYAVFFGVDDGGWATDGSQTQ